VGPGIHHAQNTSVLVTPAASPYVTLTVQLLDWADYGDGLEYRRHWALLARQQYDLAGRVWCPRPGRTWRWRVWHPLCTDAAFEGVSKGKDTARDLAGSALLKICREAVS
jgi:hypothetical protein